MIWTLTQGEPPTGLLSCVPKLVNDSLRHRSAANGCGLSISRDGDGVELSHVNLDSLGHFAQRGEGSMSASGGQEGQVPLVGEFDLMHCQSRSICSILLSVPWLMPVD